MKPKSRSGQTVRGGIKGVLFVFGALGGTKSWRIDFPVAALEGAKLYVEAISIKNLERDLERVSLGFINVAIFHRVQASAGVWAAIAQLKARGVIVVADFDDCVFSDAYGQKLISEGRSALSSVQQDIRGHYGLLEAVDQRTVTTTRLKQLVEETPAGARGHCFVLPNCFSQDLLVASIAAHRSRKGYNSRDGGVTLGYASGSASHDADFALIQPAIEALLLRHPTLRLAIVGDLICRDFPERVADRISRRGKVPHVELPRVLSSFDINLAPLAASRFNECKSPIKIIEAALVGVPTVASDTAPYREAIDHFVTGALASDVEAWESHIELLVMDDGRRKAIGAAALEYCLRAYSPVAWLSQFTAIIGEVSGAGAREIVEARVEPEPMTAGRAA